MFTNTACATAWGGVLLIRRTSLPIRSRIICFIKIRVSGCSLTASIVRCWYLNTLGLQANDFVLAGIEKLLCIDY